MIKIMFLIGTLIIVTVLFTGKNHAGTFQPSADTTSLTI